MGLLLLLIVSCFAISVSKFVTVVEFKSHVYNPSAVSISYELVNATHLNYNLTVLKVFNTDVLCSLNIKKMQKEKKMTTLLHWRHFNYCKFLEMYKTDRIFKALFMNLFQASFLTSCPLREGFYYVKNAHIDVEPLEKILPRGMYRVQLDVTVIEDGIDRVLRVFAKVSV